jgi:large subunit ribosomal protein L24
MNKIRKGDEVVVITGRDKGRRGIVEKEAALHISNVQLWNPVAKKGDRVGIRTLADGRRVRFFKSNDEVVDA